MEGGLDNVERLGRGEVLEGNEDSKVDRLGEEGERGKLENWRAGAEGDRWRKVRVGTT